MTLTHRQDKIILEYFYYSASSTSVSSVYEDLLVCLRFWFVFLLFAFSPYPLSLLCVYNFVIHHHHDQFSSIRKPSIRKKKKQWLGLHHDDDDGGGGGHRPTDPIDPIDPIEPIDLHWQ